jgi:hypothetical protein
MWNRINPILVVLTLSALALWGIVVSVVGGGYIFTALTTDVSFARISGERAMDFGIRIFFMAMIWIPIAGTLLVGLYRSRSRSDRFRRRVRQAWQCCLAFVIVFAVYLFASHQRRQHYVAAISSQSSEQAPAR